MVKKHLSIAASALLLFFVVALPAFADEDAEHDKLGFYPELVGFLVLFLSFVFLLVLANRVGEVFKKGLKNIACGAFAFTLALGVTTVAEIVGAEESVLTELLFEGFMVIGGVLLVVGGRAIDQGVKNLSVS